MSINWPVERRAPQAAEVGNYVEGVKNGSVQDRGQGRRQKMRETEESKGAEVKRQ
jgi:hypothetical protein